MNLADLVRSFEERASKTYDKSFFMSAKQIDFAKTLAHKEGLPSLPLNLGFCPLPSSKGGYIFRSLAEKGSPK